MRVPAAALAFAVLLLAGGGRAPADEWVGAQGWAYVPYGVEVPAGALPPGPAVLAADLRPRVGARHHVRFEVKAGVATHVRLVLPRAALASGAHAGLDVRATSDAGPTWTRRLEGPGDRFEGVELRAPLFVGGADELAAFVGHVRARAATPGQAETILSGLSLISPEDAVRMECRTLARHALVVDAARRPDLHASLWWCVSRGARVLVLGGAPAGFDRAPAGRATPWGLGRFAWAAGADPDAAAGALDLAGQSDVVGSLEQLVSTFSSGRVLASDGLPGEHPPGTSVVLILLALYVLAIGPIGWLVGIRPRKTWLAWGWFPMVALTATAALAVGARRAAREAVLEVTHASLTGPDGEGLAWNEATVLGAAAASYDLVVPWAQADLRDVATPFRFGTPFARPAGMVELHEDAIAASMRVSGLAVARFGLASISWAAPAHVAVPRLERDGPGAGAAWVHNATPLPIARGLVWLDGTWSAFDRVEPGARARADRPVPVGAAGSGVPRWDQAISWTGSTRWLPPSAYFLAAEMEGAADEGRTEPAITVRGHTVRTVVGPVADLEKRP